MIQSNSVRELKKGKIALVVFIVLLMIIYLYNIYFEKSLVKNSLVVNGKIISLDHPAKSVPQANFNYFIKGKNYSGSSPLPNFKNKANASVLLNKMFPVVVDSTHYTHTKMLFDSSSFMQYGLKYPDSLRWLSKYLK